MVLYFTGTGNSRYVAERIAQALGDTLCSLNDRIKAGDTSPVNSDARLIIVVPTYAWRIPHIVQEHLENTVFPGAAQVWFVMTCGGQIGGAGRHNQALAQRMGLAYQGTAQIVMPENYIALFQAPQAEEARQIVTQAEPEIDRAIAAIAKSQAFGPTPKHLLNRFSERPGEPLLLHRHREGQSLHRQRRLQRLRPVCQTMSPEQHHPARRQARLGRPLHPLHGLHLLLPDKSHRIWQEKRRQAALPF